MARHYCSNPESMKILLLSAYHAASHAQWARQLMDGFPGHDWQLLTLSPRHFYWRVRGNSVLWAFGEGEQLRQHWDLVIATSMVDLSALRGLVPELGRVPTLVYFHENQFAYPAPGMERRDNIEPRLVNLYTALCGDAVLFNSNYNRDSFLAGVDRLLSRLPERFPPVITAQLQERARVLPVAVKQFTPVGKGESGTGTGAPVKIVWNHRWEYDKGPDRLLNCIEQLPPGLALKFHVLGQRFRRVPEAFPVIEQLLRERDWLGHWGFVTARADYERLLLDSDLTLSTSLHDFQGLALLEAASAGCVPVVPDRLAYRDYIPPGFRYTSDIDNPQQEAANAAKMIEQLVQQQPDTRPPDLTHLSWDSLRPRWQALFSEVIRCDRA